MTNKIVEDMPVYVFGGNRKDCTVIHRIHNRALSVSDEIDGVMSITSKKKNNLLNRVAINKLAAQRAGKGW